MPKPPRGYCDMILKDGGGKVPFVCRKLRGHTDNHECHCGCGHEWGYFVGRRVAFKGNPGLIRVIERHGQDSRGEPLYRVRVTEDAKDYKTTQQSGSHYGCLPHPESWIRAHYEFIR